MRHDYDIFEKYTDGSTLWRACVSGKYEAHRKMQELAEHSPNEFYAIDIMVNQLISSRMKSSARPTAKAATP
jgi:hypothetical protein